MRYDRNISDGMGVIIAVVAIAALIVIGLVYFLQPAETSRPVTGEAPTQSVPAPATPSKQPGPQPAPEPKG
jgi:hypothetical protein